MSAMFSRGYTLQQEDYALLAELAARIAIDQAFADYDSDDCKLLAARLLQHDREHESLIHLADLSGEETPDETIPA